MNNTVLIILLTFYFQSVFATENKGGQFAFYISRSINNQSSTPALATNSGGGYSSVNLITEYEKSFSGGFEFRKIQSDSMVYKIGIRLMPYRQAESAYLQSTYGYGKQDLVITTPFSYQMQTLYYDIGYCWESFYLYLGLSNNILNFSSASTTSTFQGKGGSGGSFSIGWRIDDNWAIEYGARTASMSVEEINNSTGAKSTDQFNISDASFSLNYGF